MNVQYYLKLALVLILLVGCKPSDSTLPGEPAQPPYSTNTPTTSPSMIPNPAAQNLILQAQTQLAQKLDIDIEDIFLFSVEAVEWPDASFGCPQAGMEYAQVITPGYQILLEANGQVYSFHTDETSHVILCDARGPDEIYLPP